MMPTAIESATIMISAAVSAGAFLTGDVVVVVMAAGVGRVMGMVGIILSKE